MTSASLWPASLALLAAAAAIGVWRQQRRESSGWRSPWTWTSIPLAALLALMLMPVPPQAPGVLTVLTAGADRLPVPSILAGATIALPEATADRAGRRFETAPDLATALRRHPQVRRLRVIGDGLSARDRPAAAGLAIEFHAAPAQGLVEVDAAPHSVLGAPWTVRGRTAQPGATVELHDPAGGLAAEAVADSRGAFALVTATRGLGPARFELRLLDAQHHVADRASVTVIVDPGQRVRLIVRAGAPGAELKYFRRWAADAGLDLRFAAGLSEGTALRAGDVQLTPATLAATDVVVIDARAWEILSAEEKSALQSAVAQGLGLLLQADGPVPPQVAADWGAFGFRVQVADEGPAAVTLDRAFGLQQRADFSAAALAIEAPDAQPRLVADSGAPLVWLRTQGEGRVALTRWLDSYRLALGGETARYGGFWSGLVGALSRPVPPPEPTLEVPQDASLDRRIALCGLGAAATVSGPDQAAVPLRVESSGCASYWPARAGWHRFESAGRSALFDVRAAEDGRNLRAAQDRAATAELAVAGSASADRPVDTTTWRSTYRAAAFACWLVLAAVVWRRELRRPEASSV